MALNFRVNGKDTESIEWSIFVDEEGDLVLAANGTRILYIDSEDGALTRFTNRRVDLGLKLDERGRIEVAH